mgnify:CR=1 FL=1
MQGSAWLAGKSVGVVSKRAERVGELAAIDARFAPYLDARDGIKAQLEDLAFATLYPKRYAEIEQMVAARTPERERFVEGIVAQLTEQVAGLGIEAEDEDE